MKLAAVTLVVVASSTPAVAAPPGHGPAPDDSKSAAAPINQRFPTLDAYLAYLEKRSRMDGPWYRQVRPGVYELQTGNLRRADGRQGKRTFTREELERKFGFAR